MANMRGSGLSITPYEPKAATDARLAPIPMAGGEAANALASAGAALAAKTGAAADQAAADEGRRQGQIDGAAPDWRPSEDPTIRGRANDRAATEVYLSTLSAKFHSQALDLWEKTRDDPAKFTASYDGLVEGYRQQHVFPEIDGAFQADAIRLGTSLRRGALERADVRRRDQQHASLVVNMADRERSAQRLLAVDPHDPVAEAQLVRLRDEDIADIRSQIAAGSLSAVQGEKLILDRQASHQTELVTARAGTLKTPDEIDAYRARLKKDFAAGKLEGLVDFDTVDTSLAKLSKQRRTEADHALKTLQSDLSEYLDRQQAGLGGTADWAALETRAKTLGAGGEAAVGAAREKLRIRQRLAALGPDEADRLVLDLEKAAKTGPQLPPERAAIRDKIVAEATSRGLPADAVAAVVAQESNFDPSRTVATSSAFGLFQLLRKEREAAGLGDTTDVDAQIRVGMDKMVKNWEAAKAAVGRDPTAGEFYAVYYQGLGAGPKILKDPGGDFRATLDAAGGAGWGDTVIAANPWLSGIRTNQDFIDWTTRTLAKKSGVTAATADVLTDARDFAEKRRQLVGRDPLLAAQRDGLVPDIAAVDFAAAPDALAASFRRRVVQADAVASTYRRPAAYIRPDEKPVLMARLEKGGDEALATVTGLVAGAGTRAPQVLAEIGDGAPHLAHAAQVTLSTGDPAFGRQVAEAQAARAVPGAQVPSPKAADVDRVMRRELGSALQGIDAAEEARTRAAVTAWTEREMARRGIAANDLSGMEAIITDGVQRARGRTGTGDKAFGGAADVAYGPPGWISARNSTTRVQIPASVRADKFESVLGAITDEDLAGMANPPVNPAGRPLKATELRRLAPIFGSGGYRFATIDAATGQRQLAAAKSGEPFLLPWAEFAPRLRERVPDAFR